MPKIPESLQKRGPRHRDEDWKPCAHRWNRNNESESILLCIVDLKCLNMQGSPHHAIDPPFEQTCSTSAPVPSARWNAAEVRRLLTALPRSLRSEQTRRFVRHSRPSWLRACTKAATVEIPLLPAQRHHCTHTTGTANLEDKMCAEVVRKILTLLPTRSMISSWQRQGPGPGG